ncbi:MAG: M3 family oligoendopeptidase [Phycisphaeraceae bacterium]|nr:M3 family oligoendopeptidase [Phycisphaeraceae bacterium]MCW5753768.1 M3 family oligoendopeptidase [Phycisphaeraceae bacterium]
MTSRLESFVPRDLDARDWGQVSPLLDDLQHRAIESLSDLEQWLIDRSELEAACSEAQADLYIAMTCHTEDQAVQAAYTRFVEEIPPRLKPRLFELDRRLAEMAPKVGLNGARYEVLLRDTKAGVELFRQENVPLETELELLAQRFGQVIGGLTVEFAGAERTLPEMARYLESPDRAERESAWRAVAACRLGVRDTLDELLDRMIAQRHQVAKNAGFADFVGYIFKSKLRFDYTPEDCRRFHDAVEKIVVPFNERVQARRERDMGLSSLRPWDVSVDPLGRPALRPFEGGRQLYERSALAFDRLEPRLGGMFRRLGEGMAPDSPHVRTRMLDLDTRKGKAPGGYQYMRDRSREPFIFMNAAGVHRDLETMVHEAGHAFHSMLSAHEPLLHYRNAPLEFCEVASMSMELLTMPHWGDAGGFYPDGDDLARAQRQQVEGSVGTLAWIATIDAFQHWMYAHPEHTRAERGDHWLTLDRRFGSMGRYRLDWSGLDEAYRSTYWQRQGHLFMAPFYYIEYGIAQIGALQLWIKSLDEGASSAIDAYMHALRLGGSRPLPELFKACGLRFDFGPETLGPIVDRVERELEKFGA